MALRGIERRQTSVSRTALTLGGLVRADVAVALCEVEHRPMIEEKHPLWTDRITYWDVSDLPYCSAAVALPKIERYVVQLLDMLVCSDWSVMPAGVSAPCDYVRALA
jgi:hypothetical protein